MPFNRWMAKYRFINTMNLLSPENEWTGVTLWKCYKRKGLTQLLLNPGISRATLSHSFSITPHSKEPPSLLSWLVIWFTYCRPNSFCSPTASRGIFSQCIRSPVIFLLEPLVDFLYHPMRPDSSDLRTHCAHPDRVLLSALQCSVISLEEKGFCKVKISETSGLVPQFCRLLKQKIHMSTSR